MPRSLQHLASNFYGNCTCLDPAGKVMFRCAKKKMNWYLEQDLAEIVSTDPPVFRLLFQPKGSGHHGDPFFLQSRKNSCVVCGTEENLTRHHVVPYCYRKFFAKEFNRFGSYDVMMLCELHHASYEEHSDQIKQKLAVEFKAPINGLFSNEETAARKKLDEVGKLANTLVRFGAKIPSLRREEMLLPIKKYLAKDEVTEEDLKNILNTPRIVSGAIPHGKIIVSNLKGLDGWNDFNIMWRQHFISILSPKFLPEHWDPNRRFSATD